MADRRGATGSADSPGRDSWLAVLFSHAFRPFFLAAGAYGVVALLAWFFWIAIHAAGAAPVYMTISEPPHLWHAHEMVFGFATAAAGGFLLTAVPSWTGAARSRGPALAVLFGFWLAGRIAMWATALLPTGAVMAVDLLFLPALGFAAARQLAVQPAARNVVFLSLILVLFLSNLLFHLDRLEMLEHGMIQGTRLGLGTLVVMIIVIGGRVIPGFTKNALRRQGIEENLPVRRAPVDMACLVLSTAVVILLALGLDGVPVGMVALGAAGANAVRLAGWRGLATLGQPVLWVLHLGYAWIVVGFALLATALLLDWPNEVAALHAFGTGAAGSMVLGIMTRAALGHTGRPIVASRPIAAAYLLVSLAALARTFGPTLAPNFYNELMLAAGAAWIAAFALFTLIFAPILLKPRACPDETG